jgi:uncharacterized protein YfiM (DUF2279 family)
MCSGLTTGGVGMLAPASANRGDEMNRFLLLALLALLSIPSHAFDSNESDKQRHIVASALIFGSAYLITEDVTTSALITFGIGLGKELYDDRHGHGVDRQDLAANLAGIGIGILWVRKF